MIAALGVPLVLECIVGQKVDLAPVPYTFTTTVLYVLPAYYVLMYEALQDYNAF